MKHYRAWPLDAWLHQNDYQGLYDQSDQYFVQYRWPLGRWKSRFERLPVFEREPELASREVATSYAKALQARTIFWLAIGALLGWVALEVVLWLYGLQGAPWTTLAFLLLGWLWMLEDWWYREGTRLKDAEALLAAPATLDRPPAEAEEEEAEDQIEAVQQALDEVFRSTPMRENGFFRELLRENAGEPPIIRSGVVGPPASPTQEYGFHSEAISAGPPPSGSVPPADFTWTPNLGLWWRSDPATARPPAPTGSSQGRDDPVPASPPENATGSSQGRDDPARPLTMGRISVDPVTGLLVFENIYCESELGDQLDTLIRNDRHIFTRCIFSSRDPRPAIIAHSLSDLSAAADQAATGLRLTRGPITAEQAIAHVSGSAMTGVFAARLVENNETVTEPPAKEEDPPPPPVSSLERRRRRVQRILQERAEADQDDD